MRARVLAEASRRSLMRERTHRERSLKIPGKKPQLQRDFEFLAHESPDPNGHKSTLFRRTPYDKKMHALFTRAAVPFAKGDGVD